MKTTLTLAGAGGRYALGWCALSLSLAASGGDWPQWGRTADRNMYSPEKGVVAVFAPGEPKAGGEGFDARTAKNLKWVARLGVQSYGNVVVAGGRVYVGTNNEPPHDPRHQGDRSILLCLDERTGAFRWQLVVPKLASGKVNDWDGIGLLSSPVVEGHRLYLVTTRCEVLCLTDDGLGAGNVGPFKAEASYMSGPGKPKIESTGQDADIVWCYDMLNELASFPHNAANSSPLVLGEAVLAGTSNGRDWTHANTPFPDAPSLVALDKNTGRLLAEDDAGIGHRVFHGQWSSPSSGRVQGRNLIFFGGGDGWCYAFEMGFGPEKSGLKTVWRCDCNPAEYRAKEGQTAKYPSAEGPSEICATPVFYQNRVYVATGQDPEHGEGVGALTCMEATKTGDITRTGIVWRYEKIQRSLSTVSIDPETGLLFIADFAGFIHCLDAATGKVYWTHDMKAHVWGSTLVVDGKVYAGDEDGDLIVLAATREKRVISEANLGAPVYGSPVVANGTLFVQTASHLFAFQAASQGR